MKPDDLKNWRSSEGHTQEKAAQLLGMTRANYADWENGKKTRPIPKMLELACKALKAKLK